jgi:hypothetical protein
VGDEERKKGEGGEGKAGTKGSQRKHIRNQRIKPLLLKHKMHMARPIRMSLQRPEQLPHGPIMRNRIRHGHNSPEPKIAVRVAHQDPAAIGPRPVGVLHVVEALRVRLPDVDACALDGAAGQVAHGTQHETGLALRVLRQRAALREFVRFVCVKGAEDGGVRGAGRGWVVDGVDEEGDAEDVGEEDEFLFRGGKGVSRCNLSFSYVVQRLRILRNGTVCGNGE